MRGLITRIERLEAQRPKATGRTHRIIQDDETEAAARARYEHETGLAIGAGDTIIFRVIVDSTQEMAA